MRDVVIIGTDTDAGKTTFSLLFLTAFGNQYAYWKPVETGESDSEKVRRLVPDTQVFPPVARFAEPVAPALAAKLAGARMPTPKEVATRKPLVSQPLLIETFGSPLSPFTDDELQIELLRELKLPMWLVARSAVGAIGRVLQCRESLRSFGLDAEAVILMGHRDEYAETQIAKHWPNVDVVSLQPPRTWDEAGLRDAVDEQIAILTKLQPPFSGESESAETSAFAQRYFRDHQSIWHPYTSLADPTAPLPVVGADREFLHLADGRTIVDAISSWWTILHGHCHPPLMQALREATYTLDHVLFAGVTHPHAIELAEMLLKSSPWPDGRVFYSDNGSTAVEVAMKMAYQFWCHRGEPHRTLFIGFDDCYHGDTFGAMAVSRDPVFFGRFEPLLFRTARVPVNAEQLAAFLKLHHREVAAVILEPLVQGAGGMKMHSPAELRSIFDITREYGILFIADEVMTANRTGTIWAFEQAGISPDLICAAKTITGGVLPLAATLVSPKVVAEFQTQDRTKTFFHGHSFTANPLACAVAVANGKLLQLGSWRDDVARITRFWNMRLAKLREWSNVRDVRILGTSAAVELNAHGGYLAEIGPRIRERAIAAGVLLRPLGNVVYALPPLCTSDDSLAKIADAIELVVASDTAVRQPTLRRG